MLRRAAVKLLRGTVAFEHAASISRRRTSYSQFGEDLHIASYYDRLASEHNITVTGGCAVDIGAFRPIVYSNSYYFYRRKWHVINIDPTPGFKANFDRVRPRDTNLEIGIAQQAGAGRFFLFGAPSVWNTLDPAAAAAASKITGITPREVPLVLSRLDDVLDRHLGGRPFELLLIDAEGLDIEIIRSNDFTRYRPRVVMVEVMDTTVDTLAGSPVVQYLRDSGYRLYSWINPNLVLVREDSFPKV